MKRIGLTGKHEAAGKTIISSCFNLLGVAVFNADVEAKSLMNEDCNLKQSLIIEFGEKAYNNNELNRKYLSELAFNDNLVLKGLMLWYIQLFKMLLKNGLLSRAEDMSLRKLLSYLKVIHISH